MQRFNAQPVNKVLHLVHTVRTKYNSCTARSSENICSSSAGAQEKGEDKMKLSLPKTKCFCARFNAQPVNKVLHLVHKVRTKKYNSCTGRSSENICSSSGKRRRQDETQFTKNRQNAFVSFLPTPFNVNYDYLIKKIKLNQ